MLQRYTFERLPTADMCILYTFNMHIYICSNNRYMQWSENDRIN